MHIFHRLIFCFAVLFVFPSSAFSQTWAGFVPTSEKVLVFGYGNSVSEAQEKAFANCKTISNTCSKSAGASLLSNNSTVYLICCTSPRLGCLGSPNQSMTVAMERGKEALAGMGFSSCALAKTYSARTGKPN